MRREPRWEAVRTHLAPLPLKDRVYLAYAAAWKRSASGIGTIRQCWRLTECAEESEWIAIRSDAHCIA